MLSLLKATPKVMDIQAEKLSLIQWLAGINDIRIIKQFKSLQQSSEAEGSVTLSDAEKSAIDEGLQSIQKGHIQSHEAVMKTTKEKYPNLFK